MATWLGLLWLVAGIVIGLLGWAGSTGRLHRQWAGIRTPSTMRSGAAWMAAQQEGGPILLGCGALVGTAGFLLMVFRPDDDATTLVSMFLAAGIIGAVIGAGAVAVRAARSA